MKILLLVVLFIPHSVFSQNLEDCINMASLYGVDLLAPRIDQNCKSIIKNNASNISKDYSQDNYIQAFGAGNIIHILYYSEDKNGIPSLVTSGLVSGKFTELNQIKAIEIDEVGEQVFALNQAQDSSENIISVDANSDGAKAARTKLFTDDIQGAINLKTDRANQELYVLGEDWIKIFNIDANYKSTIPNQSIQVLRSISGNNTSLQDVRDLAIAGNNIYVLDGRRVLKFSRTEDGDIHPEIIATLSSEVIPEPYSIDYLKDDSSLLIIGSNNQIKISLN